MIEIKLTPSNLHMANQIAAFRHIEGIEKKGTYGVDNVRDGWQLNIIGALGELAVAKYINVFYDGNFGDFEAADAGSYQVRTCQYYKGELLLHDKDKDNDIFISVLSHKSPTFCIAGWIRGRDGKNMDYWGDKLKNGRPAFFVPRDMLKPMSELPYLR